MKNPIEDFLEYYNGLIKDTDKIEFLPSRLAELIQIRKTLVADFTAIDFLRLHLKMEIRLLQGRIQDFYHDIDGKQTSKSQWWKCECGNTAIITYIREIEVCGKCKKPNWQRV